MLLLSNLTLSVIPGIPVNIPTFLHFFPPRLSVSEPGAAAALRRAEALSAGLLQQVQSVLDVSFLRFGCGLTAVTRCRNLRILTGRGEQTAAEISGNHRRVFCFFMISAR